ncbi:hypothetical protein C9I56_35630 [Paraburkholderia caribensis]|nr:hypothetical protein C2L66_21230 [Paraburkholderia caribensis]PTB24119.1 hypothetical protein C9I56_35630 [Paraburkholderia caribensis]
MQVRFGQVTESTGRAYPWCQCSKVMRFRDGALQRPAVICSCKEHRMGARQARGQCQHCTAPVRSRECTAATRLSSQGLAVWHACCAHSQNKKGRFPTRP